MDVMHSVLRAEIDTLPSSPGVYLFYEHEDQRVPLYIGKSISIKQRVLSHCYEAKKNAREQRLMEKVSCIRWISTAGELGALLLEAALVKRYSPLYNKRLRRIRKLHYLVLDQSEPCWKIAIQSSNAAGYVTQAKCFGLFSQRRQLQSLLVSLSREHLLCPRQLGLEKGKGACFNVQIKRCLGVCCDRETADEFNARLLSTLSAYQQEAWPFQGRVGIVETDSDTNCQDIHIVDHWRYIETRCYDRLGKRVESAGLQCCPDEKLFFDRDHYQIIRQYLNNTADSTYSVVPIDSVAI